MAKHDLIVTYKHKQEHTHPLILFIGREPNDTSAFVKSVGPYNFDNAHRCAFWNTAYGVAGRVAGSDGAALKKLCRQANASPIAFTDASPVPIGHHDAKKQGRRAAISDDAINSHVADILSLDVIERVSLVVLSGHETASLPKASKELFKKSSAQLEAGFNILKIPTLKIPFLYGTNQPAIMDIIRKDTTASGLVFDAVSELATSEGTQWLKAG